ncbi:MAG: RrF2 family transcriptional regulator [Desulfosalsimonas sp.]
MNVSRKCQYALRAVFELARREGQGPSRIADVAEAQAIPARFLEVILGQLKQGGFVASRRGAEGGYLLAREPSAISMGDIIRFVDGPLVPVACDEHDGHCPLGPGCVFQPVWERATEAVTEVFDATTMADLVERQRS